jgi:amino acid transporter
VTYPTFRMPKRLLVGNPMRSNQMAETLLPKRLALPVYCSDAISSNAYATQEILLVLALGGAAMVLATPWVALVVVGLLGLVTLSYQQTCHAYPNGGGAYAVSKANLGRNASLIAAAALLVDYVMTVAVSVAASVENLTSAFPALLPYTVWVCCGIILVLMLMNLRGVHESGTLFAIPTYAFILSVFAMLAVGIYQVLVGHTPVAESASLGFSHGGPVGAALIILLLRAFASGCTALTGVEAVSNGVPTFRPPKSRNASATLLSMAGLSIAMMIGIAALSAMSRIHIAESASDLTGVPAGYEQRTVLAQLSSAIFGNNTFGFFAVQLSTTLILAMAANTAFNGFPILASILADDRFLPKQLTRRGDRLVFSNGIIMLSGIAMLLIIAFDGSVTRLIQLYILGVFVSFTLSQSGMVVYWRRQAEEHGWTFRHLGSAAINAIGAAATAIVLVIVLLTKFTHGAYLVVIAVPLLVFAMLQVKKHYTKVSHQLAPKAAGMVLPSRMHAVVLISQVNEPALKALAFAKAIRPSSITALHVDVHRLRTEKLMHEWSDREIAVPLRIVACEYRDLITPVINYLERIEIGPRDVVQVFIPEYVTGHWWEAVLHNQSALRLKSRLLYMPGVMVTSVPYQLRSAEQYSLDRPGSSAPRHKGGVDATLAPALVGASVGQTSAMAATTGTRAQPISLADADASDHDVAKGAKEGPNLAISHK